MMDQNSCKMNTLCTRNKSEIEVICFPKASCLLSFAKMFNVMTKTFNSGIFDSTWSTTMKQAHRKSPTMSIRDVEEQVWLPTFGCCREILEQLQLQSMKLGDVDRHFECYRKSEPERELLKKELKLLFKGVNRCLSQHPSDVWIRHAVLRIEEYWKQCSYCNAANSFLKLRDSLKLRSSKNFRDVEMIAREVTLFHFFHSTNA